MSYFLQVSCAKEEGNSMEQRVHFEQTLFKSLKNYYAQNYKLAETQLHSIYDELNDEHKILYINLLYQNKERKAVERELRKLLEGDFLLEINSERAFSGAIKNDSVLWIPFKKNAKKKNEKIINSTNNPKLCRQLINIYKNDQLLRRKASELLHKNKGKLSQEFMKINAKMGEIDEENIKFIVDKILCDECKFPTIDDVGEIGFSSIFHVVQHAENDSLRKLYLSKLAKQNSLKPSQEIEKMFIIDRLQLHEKGYQTYGTQYSIGQKGVSIKPIQSILFANKERLKYGLLTIEHFEEILNLKHSKTSQ
jgi:hypothetical protein